MDEIHKHENEQFANHEAIWKNQNRCLHMLHIHSLHRGELHLLNGRIQNNI